MGGRALTPDPQPLSSLGVLPEKLNRSWPGLLSRHHVGPVATLLGTEKPVAGALIDVRLIGFSEPGHLTFRGRNRGVDSGVIAAVLQPPEPDPGGSRDPKT